MLIGIDASQAAKEKKTGVEYLASQLILNLKEIDHTNSYLLFSNQRLEKKYLNKNFKQIFIPFIKFWQTFRLPLAIVKYKPEIFIEIGYKLPSLTPKNTICFVHDLASKYYPDAYSPAEKILLNQSFKKAKKAKIIIFISKNTKEDYLTHYPDYKGKNYVIYPGYNNNLYKKITKPKNVLNIKSKYILYLGRLEKRKNLENLIAAYNIFCQKNGYDYKLVLAGKKGYGFDQIETLIAALKEKVRSNIIVPGYIAEENLPNLYAEASLFVFPSFYEGFGIPVLEAMACGTPVACSNTSSLPEAGGDAVEYFDPLKPIEMSKSIEKVFFNQKLQNDMINKGFSQAKKFSYKKMASEIFKIINSI